MNIPQTHTNYEALYGPVMQIVNAKEAEDVFEALVARRIKLDGMSDEDARKTELRNIGYYAGYYNLDVRRRVLVNFGAVHPFLEMREYDAAELIELGKQLAKDWLAKIGNMTHV